MRISKDRREQIGEHGQIAIQAHLAIKISELVEVFNECEKNPTTIEEMIHGLRRFIATTPAAEVHFGIYEDQFIYAKTLSKDQIEEWAEVLENDCGCEDCACGHHLEGDEMEFFQEAEAAISQMGEKVAILKSGGKEVSAELVGLTAEISASLYGVVNFQELADILNHYHQELNVIKDDILPALTAHIDFSGDEVAYTVFEGFIIHPNILPDANEIFEDDVKMIDFIRAEQKKCERYLPTYEVFVQYTFPIYEMTSESFEDFIDFLERHQNKLSVNDEKINECIMLSYQLLKAGIEPENILEALKEEGCKFNSKSLIDEFMYYAIQLHNNIRMYGLNGFTPSEMAQKELREVPKNILKVPFGNGRKVGRNEPCPCGSGKKYKKCCLN